MAVENDGDLGGQIDQAVQQSSIDQLKKLSLMDEFNYLFAMPSINDSAPIQEPGTFKNQAPVYFGGQSSPAIQSSPIDQLKNT